MNKLKNTPETLDNNSNKTKPLSTFNEKEIDKIKTIDQIKTNETKEKSNEYFKDLKSSATRVLKEIEAWSEINSEARKERWDIIVTKVGNDFEIWSYRQKTLIKFIDDYTVSIVWWRWHDLIVEIDPIEWLDQIIRYTNIINMVMKKSVGQEKINNGTSLSLWWWLQNINKIWIDSGFGWTNLVSYSALENLSIDPDKFTTYINERKYA